MLFHNEILSFKRYTVWIARCCPQMALYASHLADFSATKRNSCDIHQTLSSTNIHVLLCKKDSNKCCTVRNKYLFKLQITIIFVLYIHFYLSKNLNELFYDLNTFSQLKDRMRLVLAKILANIFNPILLKFKLI